MRVKEHVPALVSNVGERYMYGSAVVDVLLSQASGRCRRGAIVVCSSELLLGELHREAEVLPLRELTGIDADQDQVVLKMSGDRRHELHWVHDTQNTHTPTDLARLIQRLHTALPRTDLPDSPPSPSRLASLPAEVSGRRIAVPLMKLHRSSHRGGFVWPAVAEETNRLFWDNYVNQVSGVQKAVACDEQHAGELFHSYLEVYRTPLKVVCDGYRTEGFMADAEFVQTAASAAEAELARGGPDAVGEVSLHGASLHLLFSWHGWLNVVALWHKVNRIKRSVKVSTAAIRRAPGSTQRPYRGEEHVTQRSTHYKQPQHRMVSAR